MDTKENLVKQLLSECKIYTDKPTTKLGGQSAGMTYYPTIVEHESLEIKFSINYHKSMYKNRELGLTLMELALSEIIK